MHKDRQTGVIIKIKGYILYEQNPSDGKQQLRWIIKKKLWNNDPIQIQIPKFIWNKENEVKLKAFIRKYMRMSLSNVLMYM